MSEKKEIPLGKYKKLIAVAIGYQRATRGGICGQAFTSYVCLDCDQERSHHNTATPVVCPDCEAKLKQEYQEHGDQLYNHNLKPIYIAKAKAAIEKGE